MSVYKCSKTVKFIQLLTTLVLLLVNLDYLYQQWFIGLETQQK